MCWFVHRNAIVIVGVAALFGCMIERAQSQPSDDLRQTAVEEIPPTVPGDGMPTELPPPVPAGPAGCPPEDRPPCWADYLGAWGYIDGRGFFMGERIAPNGQKYDVALGLDINLNVWLCRPQRVYITADWVFWGQRAAPDVTNDAQGQLDFSKREFDMTMGFAWNYWDRFEARAFAYSFNNLNRGLSETKPDGFKDGTGLENRYYLTDMYDRLGAPGYDVLRAPFVSLGFYPSKEFVDRTGERWKPGLFSQLYLTMDIYEDLAYLYADTSIILSRGFTPKHWNYDGGIAIRPFAHPRWEMRLGVDGLYDIPIQEWELRSYLALRYVF